MAAQYELLKELLNSGTKLSFGQDFFFKFYQAFLLKDRWMQYINGVGTTLLVTALALALGVVLGSVVALVRVTHDQQRPGHKNAVLGFFGLGPYTMLNTSGAVVLGMVYNYLPFMILPIYSVIVKLDYSLLEAARDLGANNVTVFRKVILPLSLPGVLSGITMVFVPSVSTFAISRMLGGGTELLLGDLIERQFLGGAYNPQLGAAISLVMMIIVVICMLVMNRFGEGEEQAVML